jgi:hypothetical protein
MHLALHVPFETMAMVYVFIKAYLALIIIHIFVKTCLSLIVAYVPFKMCLAPTMVNILIKMHLAHNSILLVCMKRTPRSIIFSNNEKFISLQSNAIG